MMIFSFFTAEKIRIYHMGKFSLMNSRLSDTHTNVVRHSHECIQCLFFFFFCFFFFLFFFFSVTVTAVTVRYVQTSWSRVWCSYMGGTQLSHSWSWANVHDTSIMGAAWNRSGLNTKNSLNTQKLDRAHKP